jgi:DNA-binding NarL/FixJ family response regulator
MVVEALTGARKRAVRALLARLQQGLVTEADADETFDLAYDALAIRGMVVGQAKSFKSWHREHDVPRAWVEHHHRFEHQDPANALASEPPGRVYVASRETTPEVLRTELVSGFMDCGLHDVIITRLYCPFADDLFMGLFRPRGAPAFSEDDQLLVELLQPHFAGALASRRALALLGAPDAIGAEVAGTVVLHYGRRRAVWDAQARATWQGELGPLRASDFRRLSRLLFDAAARFETPGAGGRSQLLSPGLRVELSFLPGDGGERRVLALLVREPPVPEGLLDDRAYAIAWLAAQGLTVAAIAARVGQPPAAVRAALSAIGSLLRVSDRRELALRLRGRADDDPLSPRERQILRLLDRGLSYKEIAAELRVSVHTVHSHLKNAYARLGARGRRGALARARARGLLGN